MNFSEREWVRQAVFFRSAVVKTAVTGLAVFLMLVRAFPASGQASKIQQSEQILSPAGDVVEHDTFGTAAGAGPALFFKKTNTPWVKPARIFPPNAHETPKAISPGNFIRDVLE